MAKKVIKPAAKKTSGAQSAVKRKTAPRKIAAKAKPMKTAGAVPAKKGTVCPPRGHTKADLEHFKQIILERRKDIMEELDMLRESMVDQTTGEYVTENSAYSLHMEQGTDTMEREKLFLMAGREQKFLNYLDDALVRIEKGTYGICSDCGNPIEKERLEVVPHTSLCSKCKTRKGTT